MQWERDLLLPVPEERKAKEARLPGPTKTGESRSKKAVDDNTDRKKTEIPIVHEKAQKGANS